MSNWKKIIAVTTISVFALALLPGHTEAQSAGGAVVAAAQSAEKAYVDAERVQREVEARMARVQDRLALAQVELQRNLEDRTTRLSQELAAKKMALLHDLHRKLAALQQRTWTADRGGDATYIFDDDQDVWVSMDDSGWLGVQIAEVTSEKMKELKLPAERGVLITEVEADSPAAKAGLKANDVVTQLGSQSIEGTVQFRRLVQETPAGRSVQLTVWRDGKSLPISVQLAKRSNRTASTFTRGRVMAMPKFDFKYDMPSFSLFSATAAPRLGISGEDLSGQLGKYFGAPDGEGVLVREVITDSPAEKAGMKAGDVILRIEGNRVRTLSDLREQLTAGQEKEKLGVAVLRKGAEVTLNVEIEKPKPREKVRPASRTRL